MDTPVGHSPHDIRVMLRRRGFTHVKTHKGWVSVRNWDPYNGSPLYRGVITKAPELKNLWVVMDLLLPPGVVVPEPGYWMVR